MVRILQGDCREVMAGLDAESVDSIVTDPPYGLSFMGKDWDHGIPGEQFWRAALRVAKPGAHLLAFGGTRTFHRLAVAIEDAGWEIRDCVMWVYGSGFPKSLDVSKAIDKAAGHWRGKAGEVESENGAMSGPNYERTEKGAPITATATAWSGWGTALKPSFEPVIIARKPLPEDAERRIIVGHLSRLEAQLWSILPASIAEKFFRLSQAEQNVALASAQWSAEQARNTWGDLFAQMDTSLCVSVMNTCLNIVASWKNTLAGDYEPTSTFTTETKSNPTIDWRILRCCASALTPATIIKAEILERGSASNASPAASYLNAAAMNINATRALSALEIATAEGRISLPDDLVPEVSPDWRPIIVARKKLAGTVAANVLAHGTGALNIDACRIKFASEEDKAAAAAAQRLCRDDDDRDRSAYRIDSGPHLQQSLEAWNAKADIGRWPANVIHDGSEEVVALFPSEAGAFAPVRGTEPSKPAKNTYGEYARGGGAFHGDSGSAARFFYTAKASRFDRNDGLHGQEDNPRNRGVLPKQNFHPTVKPTDLMRYLCRLVTPKGGTVLDPFMGSGSTLKAAELEGFSAIGIDLNPEYCEIARRRVASDAPLFAEVA